LDELLFDGPILLNFGIDLAFSALNLIPLPLIHWSFVRLDPQFALFANLISHGTIRKRTTKAVEDFGPKSSPSIGEKLKELLTAKPASYSEDEKPQRAEKEQMSAPQEEFIQEKP